MILRDDLKKPQQNWVNRIQSNHVGENDDFIHKFDIMARKIDRIQVVISYILIKYKNGKIY